MSELMRRDDKIYVAGHRGLVGSAVVRSLENAGFANLVQRTHAELDLTVGAQVDEFFRTERPNHVVLAAAKVGGIVANDTYPAEFIHQNLQIQTNVIDAAWRHGVQRLLFLGSSCIYPRDCPQPISESYLLTGPLEKTNRAYAVAKIAGIEMCASYNRQYGTRFLAAMPTNMYGPGDNYDLNNSHVLPALIRKMHEAKVGGAADVEIWGTGTPRRELMYSDDLGDACTFLLTLDDARYSQLLSEWDPPLVNIGVGQDLSIAELAKLAASVVGFEGKLRFDPSRPDGTPRKLLDVSRINSLGWKARMPLADGIGYAYRDFLSR